MNSVNNIINNVLSNKDDDIDKLIKNTFAQVDIENFNDEYNQFVTDYNTTVNNAGATYFKNKWNNAESTNIQKKNIAGLNNRLDRFIQSATDYADYYKQAFGEDGYNDILKRLDTLKQGVDGMGADVQKAGDYYAQWKTQDEYDKAVERNRLAETYGTDYDTVAAAIKGLQNERANIVDDKQLKAKDEEIAKAKDYLYSIGSLKQLQELDAQKKQEISDIQKRVDYTIKSASHTGSDAATSNGLNSLMARKTKLENETEQIEKNIGTFTNEKRLKDAKNAIEKNWGALFTPENLEKYGEYDKNSVSKTGIFDTRADTLYRLVNKNVGNEIAEAISVSGSEANNAVANKITYEAMTDDEIRKYNAICKLKGKEEGKRYIDELSYIVNSRAAAKKRAEIDKDIENDNAWEKAGKSALGVLERIATIGLAEKDKLNQLMTTGNLDPNSPIQNLSSNIGYKRAKISEGIDNPVGRWAYDTGMSILDNAAMMAATGFNSAATRILMGTSAGTDAAREAAERGASGGQIFLTGLAAGLAEAAWEKIPLDRLFKMGKGQVSGVVKQLLIEGGSEAATDITNAITDAAINGGLSELQTNIYAYMADGKSEEEARQLAYKDFGWQVFNSFTAGAASGAVFGGVASVAGKARLAHVQSTTLKETGGKVIAENAAEDNISLAHKIKGVLKSAEIKDETIAAAENNLKNEKVQGKLQLEIRGAITQAIAKSVDKENFNSSEGALKNVESLVTVKESLKNTVSEVKSDKIRREYENLIDNQIKEKLYYFAAEYSKEGNERAQYAMLKKANDMGISDKMLEDAVNNRDLGTDGAMAYVNVGSEVSTYIDSDRFQKVFRDIYRIGYAQTMSEDAAAKAFQDTLLDGNQIRRIYKAAKSDRFQKNVGQKVVRKIMPKKAIVFDQSVNEENFRKNHKGLFKVIEAVTSVTGIRIRLYDGSRYEGADYGSYDAKSNLLSLNVNSKTVGTAAVMQTLSHELVHFMAVANYEGFIELQQAAFDALNESGLRAEDLIAGIMQEKNDFSAAAYQAAAEEVTARGCEMLLKESKAIERLANKNQSLAKRILSFIKEKFQAIVKKLYSGAEPSLEALSLQKYSEKLVKIYDDVLVKAVENQSDGGVQDIDAAATGIKHREAQNENRVDIINRNSNERILKELAETKLIKKLDVSDETMDKIKKWKQKDDEISEINKKINEVTRLLNDPEVENSYGELENARNKLAAEKAKLWRERAYIEVDGKVQDAIEQAKDNVLDENLIAVLKERSELQRENRRIDKEITERLKQRANEEAAKIEEQRADDEDTKGEKPRSGKKASETKIVKGEQLGLLMNDAEQINNERITELEKKKKQNERRIAEIEGRKDVSALKDSDNERIFGYAAAIKAETTIEYRNERERSELVRKSRNLLSSLSKKLLSHTKGGALSVGKSCVTLLKGWLDLNDNKSSTVAEREIRENVEAFEKKFGRIEEVSPRNILDDIRKEYERIQKENHGESLDESVRYDDDLADLLQSLINSIGNKGIADLTLDEANEIYDAIKRVNHAVTVADQAFSFEYETKISDLGREACRQMREKEDHGFFNIEGKLAEQTGERNPGFIRGLGWSLLKPFTAFKIIGSNTMTELFSNLYDGENVYVKNLEKVRSTYIEANKKYNVNYDKKIVFHDNAGEEIQLTMGEAMSLCATAKRKQGRLHLEYGGFKLDRTVPYKKKRKNGKGNRKLVATDTTLHTTNYAAVKAEIWSQLSDDEQAYVNEMAHFLSNDMAKLGNAVTLKLYGVANYLETFYFPIKCIEDFNREKSETPKDKKIIKAGFTNEIVPNATKPILIRDFNTVWAEHCNQMVTYNAFALPLEDFNRVFNWHGKSDDISNESLKVLIEKKKGKNATNYIDRLIQDINGGIRVQEDTNIASWLISKYKKSATFMSLSITAQQPSAVGRTYYKIPAKYLFSTLLNKKPQTLAQAKAQMKEYAAGVTGIKEMGGYDIGIGKGSVEWILQSEYEGAEKLKEFFSIKDGTYRDDVFSMPAAAADMITWEHIWLATRKWQANELGMSESSEAVLEATGKEFSEVIRKTQVYDSKMSQTQIMRNKGLFSKMTTSFMAEPLTTLNMFIDAACTEDPKQRKVAMSKALVAFVSSTCINAMNKSLVTVGRRDEKKPWLEKYLGEIAGNIIDDANPLNMIPYIRDFVSITQGWTVERMDAAFISQMWEAAQKAIKEFKGDNYAEAFGDLFKIAGMITGIPVKNIERDVKGLIQTYNDVVFGGKATFEGIAESVKTGAFGESDKAKQMYNAIYAGNSREYDRIASYLKDNGKSDEQVRNMLKTYLKDHDEDVYSAAKAELENDYTTATQLIEDLSDRGFDIDTVESAVKAKKKDFVVDDDGRVSEKTKEQLKAEKEKKQAAEAKFEEYRAEYLEDVEDVEQYGELQHEYRGKVRDKLKAYYRAKAYEKELTEKNMLNAEQAEEEGVTPAEYFTLMMAAKQIAAERTGNPNAQPKRSDWRRAANSSGLANSQILAILRNIK